MLYCFEKWRNSPIGEQLKENADSEIELMCLKVNVILSFLLCKLYPGNLCGPAMVSQVK